ncbi:MAG: AI-2E family transporter [Chloroflexi bacterium]|nr:AI-2E family transporter [Ardenticatenaceae bacterium]NOG35355.1 AI-2E family transporter [Chloroflexota bacterium]GIK56965.1 MAG: hypothetical protein BroJett015_26280 [Chloroflexota bacterium]
MAGLAFFVLELIPLLSLQLNFLYSNLPAPEEIQDMVGTLNAFVQALLTPIQATMHDIIEIAAESAQTKLDAAIRQVVNLGLGGLLSLINTLGFVLGFLIIPAWLLDVLRDHQVGIRTINRNLPKQARPDFWPVAHLIDRPFRAFFAGQVVLAIAARVGIYLGRCC